MFFGDFEQGDCGSGEEWRFWGCGTSGIYVKSFRFPFYATIVCVSINKGVEAILFGDFAHSSHAEHGSWVIALT